MGSSPRARPAVRSTAPWRREAALSQRLELLAAAVSGVAARLAGSRSTALPPRRSPERHRRPRPT